MPKKGHLFERGKGGEESVGRTQAGTLGGPGGPCAGRSGSIFGDFRNSEG